MRPARRCGDAAFEIEERRRHLGVGRVADALAVIFDSADTRVAHLEKRYAERLKGGEIGHRTTRVKWAQSNGIIERFHRTLLDEHFRVEGRRTWFETIEEMQGVLDDYLVIYNTRRPHQRRGMNGRTPAQAFIEGLPNASQQEVTARPKQTKHKTA
ncbi:MAG: transposase [Methylobacterium sp.]|nr:transposase [Methylobacterium sp.]MCA3635716.1 transposase [Methylobacterium sp.]MCA3638493.1 transposase [Methylobacterium sp.]